jgi:DNA-binding Lrp family transcriptional regulator
MMTKDSEILLAVQDGIPLVREPFAEASEALEISQENLIERLKGMREDGTIRRFAPNINQRKIGIIANAVVVWRVPEENISRVVETMLKYNKISHCYRRATVPGKWEYNLYTVIHDYDKKSVSQFVRRLSKETGIKDYQVLYSRRQFKRTSSRISRLNR